MQVSRCQLSKGESELFFDIARARVPRVTTALTQPMTMLSPAPNGGDVSMKMLIKSTLTLELVGAAVSEHAAVLPRRRRPPAH